MEAIAIGAGFAGLSAACCLAQAGVEVTVLEKNESPGGRARVYRADGFTFDMGPSWYWMPDVFGQFFRRFGKTPADYYQLRRLDPSYQVIFGKDDALEVPAGMEALEAMFEKMEPGSVPRLRKFLAEAEYKYRVGMQEFVYRPGHSIWEFADLRVLRSLFRLGMTQSMSGHLRRYFRNERLLRLLEFPVLFLGAMPQKTPAMYSLMNYADMALGTWYPMGGMGKIVDGMVSLATDLGVIIHCGAEVERIEVANGQATGVVMRGDQLPESLKLSGSSWLPTPQSLFAVIAAADYHHVEQNLLPPAHRRYSPAYWRDRTLAPSCLLFYVGVEGRIPRLIHHNLFFDENFRQHAIEIYEKPQWPEKPLFYACCPSKTDPTVAPPGCENLFILIPVAPGLDDSPAIREHYFGQILARLETFTGQSLAGRIRHRRSYCIADFEADYHALRGNAYGLANTLNQTAFLKPKMKAPSVANLWFAGQLTTPGPGVPPALISGQVAAAEVLKYLRI